MRKICIFTSTRAEWGLLSGVAKEIAASDELELQVLVSGTHLSEPHGHTVDEIKAAGFVVSAEVDILQFDDSPQGICQSMGLAISGYGTALAELKPDILLILGDRYEAFCAAAAAQITCTPVAHIHGGERTEGAVDEAFRHSITKMSHLHFPCCEEYRNRIIQLGEDPARVFNVGSLGIENIRTVRLMEREALAASVGFRLDRPFFLITFHPVTLETNHAGEQFDALLTALDQFPDHGLIFTKANADTGGAVINEKMEACAVAQPGRCMAIDSLGLQRYLSAMNLCDAVVGNSSSGIIEAPAFCVPTVNIGDRQKGRLRTRSIIDCTSDSSAICSALRQAVDPEFRSSLKGMEHPCEKAHTAQHIVDGLKQVDGPALLKKTFIDLAGRDA